VLRLCGAGNWTLRKVYQKCLESLEMWCWMWLENISWNRSCVKNEEVLHRVKEKRKFLQTIKRRMASWSDHILRRSCFLNGVIFVKIEGTGR